MTSRPRVPVVFQAFLALAAASWAPRAGAAVPAEYAGTPYQGVAQTIPGRVELANLDEGGLDVAFFADHRRENAVAEGYSPISGDDHRPGNLDLPNICKTNKSLEPGGIGSEDFWEDGKRYPSDEKLAEYYMGYAHTVDWVRVTVNVQQAGTYNVSSNWACANPQCGLSIWFNDGTTTAENPDRPLDGENKSGVIMLEGTNDYHKWRAYPNFAQVELSAGEQLMTFNLEVADHLQYGFLQFDLVGGGGGPGAGGAGGSAGAASAGAAPTAAGGSAGPATTTGGVQGSGGAPTSAGTGSVVPSAGSGGSSSTPGLTSGTASDQGGSCTITPHTPQRSRSALGLLLAASALLVRRRAKSAALTESA